MAKTNQIKKLVNGEIADADDVNQIVENAGSEGGLIPYSEVDQQRETDGTKTLGSVLYPWGTLNINQDAYLNEVETTSPSIAAQVLIKNLRRFIYLKDAPNSYAGNANQFVRVKASEDGLEFVSGAAVEIFSTPGAGTWTCPADVHFIRIDMCGGGGAGAMSFINTGIYVTGSGGGGGAGLRGYIMKVTPGVTYNFTVGDGGAIGAGHAQLDAGRAGQNGGTTSFVGDVETLTCPGGNKATVNGGTGVSTGGTAGAGSGSIDASGATPGGMIIEAGGAGATYASGITGAGGGSIFSRGGEVLAQHGIKAGPGAGGAGSYGNGGASAYDAQPGGDGIIMISYAIDE